MKHLKNTTHIVVATPGRLADLIERNAINVKEITYFVLDEADEMVSAHKEGVDAIIKALPKTEEHYCLQQPCLVQLSNWYKIVCLKKW